MVSDALDVTQKLSEADQAQAKDIHGPRRSSQRNREMPAGLDRCPYGPVPNSERAVFCQETRNLAASGRVQTFRFGDVDSVHLAKAWLGPIEQVFMYRSKLKVRYGCIMTEKELVITCIRPLSQDHLRCPVNTQDSSLSSPSSKKRATAITSESSENS